MVYKLPVFKKCCFCIPLRAGVVIVGYWSIFSKLWIIFWNIKQLATMTIDSSSRAGLSKLLARTYMFRSLAVIVSVVYIVLSVMLLIGVRKRNPEYLRHFFMSCLVTTVVDVVVTGFALIRLRHWMFSIGLMWTASSVYMLLIVRSSFLAMEEKERGPRSNEREQEEEVCWDTMRLAHVV